MTTLRSSARDAEYSRDKYTNVSRPKRRPPIRTTSSTRATMFFGAFQRSCRPKDSLIDLRSWRLVEQLSSASTRTWEILQTDPTVSPLPNRSKEDPRGRSPNDLRNKDTVFPMNTGTVEGDSRDVDFREERTLEKEDRYSPCENMSSGR